MKTNNIKSFAKKARLILLDGVMSRLKYWGFDEAGRSSHEVQSTYGGYTFRSQIFNDPTVPSKWNKLKNRLINKQAVEDVIEEAAYTWFNRLMAIKILEENKYLPQQLAYAAETRTPAIVQNAKRGQHQLKHKADIDLLNEYLRENREEQAFGLLLTQLCHENKLLHDVFGRIDDYTELLLPQNLLNKEGLIDLINSDIIDAVDYKEVELIGWLYQFYISDKKDKVFADFKKNKKARAEDIPAATQIFTPKWVVKYMVENTVGKIYLDYEPTSSLREEMKYLVENKQETEFNEKPESKRNPDLFEGLDKTPDTTPLISDITQLTLLDPASGSGHILVTGFDLLFKMYKEVGYSSRNAVESILKNNLFGLEIDDRAMQLARFAILLKAAQYDAAILNRDMIPHVYSFPEADHFSTEELHLFLGYDGQAYTAELKDALTLMNQGKNIGSALKLHLSENCKAHLLKTFKQWIDKAANLALDIEKLGIWYRLQAFLEVLLLMTRQYTAVVANPPYMGQKNMNAELKEYINRHYPVSKSDLFAVFMEVIPNFTAKHSRFAMINLPSWLFLSSFEQLREIFINNYSFDSLLHFGRGIFGIDFGSVAFAIKKVKLAEAKGTYFRLHERNFQHIYYEDIEKLFLFSKGNEDYKYDFSQYRDDEGVTEIPPAGTQTGLRIYYPNIPQANFSKIPGSPIAYWVSERVINSISRNKPLGDVSEPRAGLQTSDNDRFLRFWHEVNLLKIGFGLERVFALMSDYKWFPHNKGGGKSKWYGNNSIVINFENDGKELKFWLENNPNDPTTTHWSRNLRNYTFYFKEGLTWGAVSSQGITCRYTPIGFLFDTSGPMIFSKDNLLYILPLINSKVFNLFLNIFSQTLSKGSGDFAKVPFVSNKEYKALVEDLSQKCILNCKTDWDSRETSWDFEKSPLLNNGKSLSLAYQGWQQQAGNDFFQLHANEEELNRIFIEIYGLQDELTPEVPLKDITILQEELDRGKLEELQPAFREKGKDAVALPIKKEEVISQFISYCIGVMMGRYRLDKPGLNIAHPNPAEEELAAYTHNGYAINIDEDAILPLMGEDCSFPDDVLMQLKHLLLAIWGEETLTANINFIQECLGKSPHQWITQDFWGYHTRMYKTKPIYWLFTSNPKKPGKAAFKVLVYMHRMNRFTVQQIQRRYLYPQQEYIKREIQRLKEDESRLNREEQKRLEMLQNWEVECRGYNEVLKELANQQIEFDLDDGVSVNYEKFKGAVAEI